MVVWPKITRPIELGGLGVLDLTILGHALRLRWAWLARRDPSRTWSALPAAGDKVECAIFEASTSVVVGNGTETWFWRDKWLDGLSIKSIAPDLFAAVDKKVVQVRTVAQGM
jgi:hypothetical protein